MKPEIIIEKIDLCIEEQQEYIRSMRGKKDPFHLVVGSNGIIVGLRLAKEFIQKEEQSNA